MGARAEPRRLYKSGQPNNPMAVLEGESAIIPLVILDLPELVGDDAGLLEANAETADGVAIDVVELSLEPLPILRQLPCASGGPPRRTPTAIDTEEFGQTQKAVRIYRSPLTTTQATKRMAQQDKDSTIGRSG